MEQLPLSSTIQVNLKLKKTVLCFKHISAPFILIYSCVFLSTMGRICLHFDLSWIQLMMYNNMKISHCDMRSTRKRRWSFDQQVYTLRLGGSAATLSTDYFQQHSKVNDSKVFNTGLPNRFYPRQHVICVRSQLASRQKEHLNCCSDQFPDLETLNPL